MSKYLVAPLNWGLGHATRCIPVIRQLMSDGHEVVIGGDGQSFDFLHDYFPDLRTITLSSLNLHYSEGKSQVWTLVKQLPHIISWMRQDAKAIRQLQEKEHFDVVISDNRFKLCAELQKSNADGEGLPYTIYITHQLHICMPKGWRWLELVAEQWHKKIIERYNECWIPDHDIFPSLAGILSHPKHLPRNAHYIGPLSRFEGQKTKDKVSANVVLALISGLEPQRTLFEQQIREKYKDNNLIIVSGRPPYPTDSQILEYIRQADVIVSRSGYSSIMDFAALGVLDKVRMTPTAGQPEQEYLAELHNSSKKSTFY